MPQDNRPSAAAVWRSERTSTGFHPARSRNAGPSSGANLNGAPACSMQLNRFVRLPHHKFQPETSSMMNS